MEEGNGEASTGEQRGGAATGDGSDEQESEAPSDEGPSEDDSPSYDENPSYEDIELMYDDVHQGHGIAAFAGDGGVKGDQEDGSEYPTDDEQQEDEDGNDSHEIREWEKSGIKWSKNGPPRRLFDYGEWRG